MANSTGILQINNKNVVDPQTMEWQIMDLDSEQGTGRNQKGTMLRDRVAVKRKLVCSFPPLTAAECSNLLKAVSPQTFTIRYPDAYTGNKRTSTFYVGDRNAPVYRFGSGASDSNRWLWINVSFDFIEV